MPNRIARLFNESCMETMARFSDKEMDMIITSPPYNMNLRVRNGSILERRVSASVNWDNKNLVSWGPSAIQD